MTNHTILAAVVDYVAAHHVPADYAFLPAGMQRLVDGLFFWYWYPDLR